MSVPLITGTVGAGKSAVAREVGELVRLTRVAGGLIDLDALSYVAPGPCRNEFVAWLGAMTLVIAARLTYDTSSPDVGPRKERAMEIINLGAADGLPPVEWNAVIETLDAGSAPAPDAHNARTKWLATINEDGSAHVTAVGALWLEGTFWFQTGPGTRKGRNVARDPRCSIAVSIRDADVVFEGAATRVTEPGVVARIAKAWADDGWPAEPHEGGSGITAPFNAPSQGPPPWNVYRIEPRSATVVLGTEPGGLTRFRF